MNDPLSRRDACRTLVAGAAALAFGSRARSANAQPEKFKLHYALASSMYGKLPIAEILPEVARTGADSIDLWPVPHGDQREQVAALGDDGFAELLYRHRVKLSMTTRYDLGPEKLADEVTFVNKFGGNLIVTGSKGRGSGALKAEVKAFVEKLVPHAEFAIEKGVTIGIENHSSSLINEPDSLRYFAEFAPDGLGIAFAVYHLPQDPELLAGLIRDLGPKLAHFYAWEHGMGCMEKLPKEQEMLQLPGYGKFDFAPLLAALQSTNYKRLTEIFMHPVPRGIPILETAAQVTDAINVSRSRLEAQLSAV